MYFNLELHLSCAIAEKEHTLCFNFLKSALQYASQFSKLHAMAN